MSQPLPAAIAFFAFGALFAGTILLLLVDSRSRTIRWWAIFQAANLVWLAGQGWAFAADAWVQVDRLSSGTVHMLPALFLAFALAGTGRPDRGALLAVALGLVTLPLDQLSVGRTFAEGWLAAWHIGMWGTGTVILVRSRWGNPRQPGLDRRTLCCWSWEG